MELTPADLGGNSIQVDISWIGLQITTPSSGLACDTYAGILYAYDRDETGAWKPFDHRAYTARANTSGSVCEPVLTSYGDDGPEFDFPEVPQQLFLAPNRHRNGVLIVAGMYRDCEPLPLDIKLAEYF